MKRSNFCLSLIAALLICFGAFVSSGTASGAPVPTAARIGVTKSTIDAGTNAAHCVDGKNGSVKIARSTPTMNVAGVAGSRSRNQLSPFQLSGRRYDQ